MRYATTVTSSVAGAALLFGGLAFGQNQVPSARPMETQTTIITTSSQPLAFPAGFVNKELHEVNDIKSELGKIASDAVTKDHFDNLINQLSKQDATRIGDFKNRDVTTLNGRIDQINKAWKAKYGKDFDLDYKPVFDDRFAVLQGEIADPAVALNTWPVPATAMAMKASERQMPTVATDSKIEKAAEKDAKMDKGRNVALVRIPAGHGLPELTVSMLHELPDMWKVDVPNDRSGQQIYDALLNQLTYIGEHTDQWPADVNDAYRFVAHSTLAALYGVDRMDMSNMQHP